MKYKTTKKAVMNGYAHVIYTGYCNLQTLLSWKPETAYTTRAEGWGADVYDFGNTAIVTGYAPFGNIRPDYALCMKYEEAARGIKQERDTPYDEQKKRLEALTGKFIKEVKGL